MHTQSTPSKRYSEIFGPKTYGHAARVKVHVGQHACTNIFPNAHAHLLDHVLYMQLFQISNLQSSKYMHECILIASKIVIEALMHYRTGSDF